LLYFVPNAINNEWPVETEMVFECADVISLSIDLKGDKCQTVFSAAKSATLSALILFMAFSPELATSFITQSTDTIALRLETHRNTFASQSWPLYWREAN